MIIKSIETRDVATLGRAKHYEFTIVCEDGPRVRVTAGELLSFERCCEAILEQTGKILQTPTVQPWHAFLRKCLNEKKESSKADYLEWARKGE